MAADCAVELRKHNVAFVSLWPGWVMTELMDECAQTSTDKMLVRSIKYTYICGVDEVMICEISSFQQTTPLDNYTVDVSWTKQV